MSYGGGYPPGPSYPHPPGQSRPSQHGPSGRPPPPNVPPPWRAEWSEQEYHYVYTNTENGHRQYEFPGPRPPNAPGYHRGPPPPQGYGPPPPGYGPGPQSHGPPPSQPPKQGGHNWKDMAIGGAGGALLGGFVTHEWDEHKEHEKEERWRHEHREDEDEIARLRRENENLERREEVQPIYGGGEYGRVEERRDYEGGYENRDTEYIRDDNVYVENTYINERRDDDYVRDDTFVERRDDIYEQDSYRRDDYDDSYRDQDQGLVSEVVDDVAGWAGRQEGKVERFGDDVQDSFDDGRDYERYDDRY